MAMDTMYKSVKIAKGYGNLFDYKWECLICGKAIFPRGANAHAQWHIKKGDAEYVKRERIEKYGVLVADNGIEYEF